MNEYQLSDLAEKISKGLDIAFYKLVSDKAKNNGVLILSDEDGKIIRVKAKDLLKDFPDNSITLNE
jgi:5S rRNA maturation endonuclease (ribonuclease M5)